MSATGFRAADGQLRRHEAVLRDPTGRVGLMLDLALFGFCCAMLYIMHVEAGEETIPYHFLFLSVAILYGFRVWPLIPTIAVILIITLATGLIMWDHYRGGWIDAPELAEIPLMPALLVAMVWHARRRVSAQIALEEMAAQRSDMLEREREFLRN